MVAGLRYWCSPTARETAFVSRLIKRIKSVQTGNAPPQEIKFRLIIRGEMAAVVYCVFVGRANVLTLVCLMLIIFGICVVVVACVGRVLTCARTCTVVWMLCLKWFVPRVESEC